ncbi:CinA family protein [Microbacterium azadirachtae]|uniref:CinA family protein n=1 Tax=Microbacterium azadirachtae TaxID=582680 RepID=UPI000882797A|nr:CinA family protein [Microbacterium azadirachtae]UXW87641.1 CinA family protein [Microbacterium azadirachtae]SDL41740.1 nicotinamide-nucleotide amidase [Microbacterium azadirachtae]SEF72392.1 nicotinamide-nucleotide amidase [Microbacterium azadirachtae]SEF73107.1 nicotinamide-nucleotide amidase [Microbacterium azadirachtae]
MDGATPQAAAVLDALRERGMTLAVAESLTGGALSAALVAVPGASDALNGAVVAYATPLKASVLGVDSDVLARRGPVDPEVARQMALGARSALAVEGRIADAGVATTGVAGPTPQGGQPVGTVHIGVSVGDRSLSRAFLFSGDRAAIRAATVEASLVFLLEVIAGLEPARDAPVHDGGE